MGAIPTYRSIPQCGVNLIKSFETFRGLCYDDKQPNVAKPIHVLGNPTWGYGDLHRLDGTALTDDDVGVATISEPDAEKLLALRLAQFGHDITLACGPNVYRLTDDEYGALGSFFYNVGLEHAPVVISLVKTGQFNIVPSHLSLYVNSGGQRSQGLVNRRRAEVDLWHQAVTSQEAPTSAEPTSTTKPFLQSRLTWASITGGVMGLAAAVGAGAGAALPVLTQYAEDSGVLHQWVSYTAMASAVCAFIAAGLHHDDLSKGSQA